MRLLLALVALRLVACRDRPGSVRERDPAPVPTVAGPASAAPLPLVAPAVNPAVVTPEPPAPPAPAASLPRPDLPPLDRGVVLTLNVSEGRSHVLSGETNLPDGTRMMVSPLATAGDRPPPGSPARGSAPPGGTALTRHHLALDSVEDARRPGQDRRTRSVSPPGRRAGVDVARLVA